MRSPRSIAMALQPVLLIEAFTRGSLAEHAPSWSPESDSLAQTSITIHLHVSRLLSVHNEYTIDYKDKDHSSELVDS